MSYAADRAWSDQFIPSMRTLIGPHLLEPSSLEVDQKQAADLVVFRARDVTVACRVRRPGYADRYPFEFTVRKHRDSGAPTELRKLVEGWGDWMFYGHAARSGGPTIERWWLLDLSAWRAALIRDQKRIVQFDKSNGDGTHFVAFDVRSFPNRPGCKRLVIASSHSIAEHAPPARMDVAERASARLHSPPEDDEGVEGWLARYDAEDARMPARQFALDL